MNKYFLEEGAVWIFMGLIFSLIWPSIAAIVASLAGIFSFVMEDAILGESPFIGLLVGYGAISIGALIFIGGLFVDGKNDYFETRGLSGKIRLERREKEVLKYKNHKELLKTNEEWKKIRKKNSQVFVKEP